MRNRRKSLLIGLLSAVITFTTLNVVARQNHWQYGRQHWHHCGPHDQAGRWQHEQ